MTRITNFNEFANAYRNLNRPFIDKLYTEVNELKAKLSNTELTPNEVNMLKLKINKLETIASKQWDAIVKKANELGTPMTLRESVIENMKYSYKRNIMLQQPLLLKILNIN